MLRKTQIQIVTVGPNIVKPKMVEVVRRYDVPKPKPIVINTTAAPVPLFFNKQAEPKLKPKGLLKS